MKRTRPADCQGCPANSVGVGWVPPIGPQDAPLLLIGQGPGTEEADCGRPFVGRAGQRLTRWCLAAGIDKPAARVANVVQCHLPNNRPPTPAEVEFCRTAHWGVEVERPRRVTVAVGAPAQKALGLREGCWERRGDGWGVGIVHPAAIIRGSWGKDPAQITHLRRAAQVLAGAEPEVPDFSRPPAGANLWPTLTELQEWEAGIGPGGITIDVEAAANILRVVGLIRNDDLRSVSVGFRGEQGELWVWCPVCRGRDAPCPHPRDDFDKVVVWLAQLLANPAISKAFHNGSSYDVPEQLENVGFVVRGYDKDTLLMAHIRLPEMQKGLEPLSALYLGVAGWKSLADSEGEGELK
jgi:uracil-DNA glycosylase family 4